MKNELGLLQKAKNKVFMEEKRSEGGREPPLGVDETVINDDKEKSELLDFYSAWVFLFVCFVKENGL